jgi:hypothetical protein
MLTNKVRPEDIQSLGRSLLYFCPSAWMMRPNITKLAASRGVGAMIVAVILEENNSGQPSKPASIPHYQRTQSEMVWNLVARYSTRVDRPIPGSQWTHRELQ